MTASSRRRFLGQGAAGAAWLAGGWTSRGADDAAAGPRPTPAQLRWQQCEVGVIFHFDMPVAAGAFAPNNEIRTTFDPSLYNPEALDTDAWAAAAKAAGARYAVFTATHFNGFLQWQSDAYPYGLRQAKWRGGKGDVVADFVASCRRADLLPGIYFSTHRNAWWTAWGHYVDGGAGRGTEKQKAFCRASERMTEELCSRYGPLVQIWYDAGVKTPAEDGPDVLPIFEKHQPDSVFYHSRQRSDHRWIGNEKGFAGDPCWATMPGGEVSHNAAAWKPLLASGDPDGTVWSPGMVDVPLRGTNGVHDWLWRPDREKGIEPVETLLRMYEQSVGRNSVFTVGAVVDPKGRLPEPDAVRLAEFGRAVQARYGREAAAGAGDGDSIEVRLPKPARVERVSIAEDIAHGERIREYRVEGHVGADTWKPLAAGQSVGHRRLHAFDPVEVAAVRLVVARARGTPRIRRLAVY
ncbi:MAG: alpha-L-fucosidase [Lentisphaerae bacterium]|nr:alpha-L-fucosidase [Lentisphaerota bacterium]